MILPDVPGLILVPLSLRFRGIEEIGNPVLGLPVSQSHPEYPVEPVLVEVDHPTLRWDFDLREGAVEGVIGIHQPVGLEAGNSVPNE